MSIQLQSIANIIKEELNFDKQTQQAAEILFSDKDKEVSEDVKKIVDGVRKIENLKYDRVEQNLEKFIKLILTISDDVRSVIVLIAKYLYLLRNYEQLQPQLQKQVLQKSKYLYSTIAHRLGLYKIKREFEEKIMQIEHPKEYNEILQKLQESRPKLEKYIKDFIKDIERIIKPLGYKYRIKGRVKSVASIWKKMQRKGVSFEEVLDVFAIRIILDVEQEREIGACWDVFSVIQQHYQLHPSRIKDWLSNPKSNGYMSLHLTVLNKDNRWIELQIRSERMDEIAENGLAAHWKYKEYTDQANKEDIFAKIRKALETPVQRGGRPILTTNEIYVYTPKGDLITLPKGAVVLDFAFYIHSKLGEQCIGAIVNNKYVSYKYPLQNGDVVKIVISKNQKPKKEWLEIVKTSRAKRKIKQLLAYQQYKWIQIGREVIQRKLKKLDLPYDHKNLEKIRQFYGLQSIVELFELVGSDKLDLKNFKEIFIQRPIEQKVIIQEVEPTKPTTEIKKFIIETEVSLDDVQMRVAKCCNPTIGDDVFILRTTAGLVIHKTDCPNALRFINKNPSDRYLYGKWTKKTRFRKFTKIRFRSKKKDFTAEDLEKILSQLDLNIYRKKVYNSKDKHKRIYLITDDLGYEKRKKISDYLKQQGFVKINFVDITTKVKD